MREIKLTYFKKSGKYYCEAGYISNKIYEFEVYDEVRQMANNGNLPGLSSGGKSSGFIILVEPIDGVPAIVYEKDS